ncbi:NAD-dependent protein deacylase [Virgibacillus sp. W0430]|uniref:NAD-dependent protein deacylase n=1 Tax=Virgibacillus sp. W0430 TaxID=3391580 RepID=UPI003F46C807
MHTLLNLLTSSSYPVIYTGAGMSTESGLPDFRSKSRGLWERFNPDELANVQALHNNTKAFTDFYRYRLSELNKYKPHEGHFILGKWEKAGLIKSIITQNVDGFHQDAGNENVMELHGSFRTLHCNECKKETSRNAYLSGTSICSCGGTIRPGIVLFGESLPQNVFKKAEQETRKADLFIVLGSSLSVSPANLLPLDAKESGAKLVIVNREPTELDTYADHLIGSRTIKELLMDINVHVEELLADKDET